jgi:formylglycine-generating enzyme required for sulfatase activity
MSGLCDPSFMPRVSPAQLRFLGIRGIALLAMSASGCSTSHAAPPEKAAKAEPATPAESVAPPQKAAEPPKGRCDAVRCASIERCDDASGKCVPSCPAGEVYIPATGPDGYTMGRGFTMGATGKFVGKGHLANSDRPHKVILTRPFCMDETEVTVAAYRTCVDTGVCKPPKIAEVRANYPKKPDHPVNEVMWPKAKAYCEWRKQSLPTEAQWEWAATGGDGRRYPWGNEEPTCEYADFTEGVLVSPGGDSGCHGGGSSPVKAHPKGNKVWPAGILYDMAGNVWEWCLDSYEPYPDGEVVDPLVPGPDLGIHVVRGGGWNRSARGIQAAFRGAAIYTYEVGGLGFRCVRNPAPQASSSASR